VQGGALWRVVAQDGTIVMEAATATLSGTVVDSLDAGPVAGARVRIADGPADRVDAVTGKAGTYLIAGVPPGQQVVEVRAPSLDSLGLGPITGSVEAVAGEIVTDRLRVPGVGEILQGVCAEPDSVRGHTAILLGRLLRDGAPAEGVRVRVRFLGPVTFPVQRAAAPPRASGADLVWTLAPEDTHWITTTVDDRGVFMLCGVPAGWTVRIEARADREDRVVRTVTIDRTNGVVVVPLNIDEKGVDIEARKPPGNTGRRGLAGDHDPGARGSPPARRGPTGR